MAKKKATTSITVKQFYDSYKEVLSLEMITTSDEGMERLISEPTINRPGLAMAGFFSYFAGKRVQVFGSAEIAYLAKLPSPLRTKRIDRMCSTTLPCIVFARNEYPPQELIDVAKDHNICVFRSKLLTMKFINVATIKLEADLAESTTIHGCMVEYKGMGVLIKGHSGIGKSETAIGILERGGCLVADDVVHARNIGGEIIASAPEIARGYIEVRGVGIINVTNLYGMSALRQEKKLELIITLKNDKAINEVDRLGLERGSIDILDVPIIHIELPISAGRDSARLIEVAVLDQQLKNIGIDMAKEFSNRILEKMKEKLPK